MGFYETIKKYPSIKKEDFFIQSSDLFSSAISKESLGVDELKALLSFPDDGKLEAMAARAHELTVRYFGKTMLLYTPMYISDYCDNGCVYCGFRNESKFARRRLTSDEIEREAEFLSKKGIKHLLVLTGGSRTKSPVSYIESAVKILNKYFPSISLEVYALSEDEYRVLIEAGVDGLTIYQETYDEPLYRKLHPSGEKKNYLYRLDAPERAARAGMRTVNIGSLLGLSDWRMETFFTALHARYLMDNYPASDISVSIPRMRPYEGALDIFHNVTDRDMVQIITTLRIFLPRAGVTMSTREGAHFRDNAINLGVTKLSAGSSTMVGGHTAIDDKNRDNARPQFDISDVRDIEEIKAMLRSRGYDPVMKDWVGEISS